MVLENPSLLWLLPILLGALAGLWWVGWKTKRRAAELLSLDTQRLQARLTEKYVLAGLFTVCLVAALASPKVPSVAMQIPQRAGEIALLVDVSASMAAEKDLGAPNRLERAKQISLEIVDQMEELGDVKLSLHGVTSIARSHVPFVGREDYPYLRESIAKVLGINSVPGGGTSLGRPISNVVGKFSADEQTRMIVWLSDGEVFIGQTRGIHQIERDWIEEAIAQATKQGVKVVTVGVGEQQGAKIPYTDQGGYTGDYAEVDGTDFVTYLQEQGLQEIAARTGGKYFSETNRNGLVAFIRENLRSVSAEGEARQVTTYRSVAPWFALAALSLWLAIVRRHLL